jgi:hypothetical protein
VDFKVDWISFTIPLPGIVDSGEEEAQRFILDRVIEFLGPSWEPVTGRHGWEIHQGRGFYKHVMLDPDTKLSIQWGDVNSHIYCECSGFTCRFIDNVSSCEDFLQTVGTRTCRIDIACDIESDTKPPDFIVNNEGKSFSAGGHIFSKDGETCYVGSRKGERFARVYRYHEPHPRAKFLRVETVQRGDYAKALAARILQDGLVEASLASNQPYGWRHPDWDPSMVSVSKITAPRSSIGEASTIRWLVDVVAPSLARACRENLIKLDEYIEQHVKPKM